MDERYLPYQWNDLRDCPQLCTGKDIVVTFDVVFSGADEMKTYRVGIYVRLSRDDERQGESVSIENQKLMLQRYCEQQKWEVGEIYVDDGWSGTNFDRPGFIRMMEAVREKWINLVLVKDLSRLGRDYIEVGKYTDCVFPYYNCRFIALNDGVDTLCQSDDVAMIFKNVINDIYARDTSRKIRAVRRANAENGRFMGYKPPYGYLRSSEDKHRLVIDPMTSEVVKKIFALRKDQCGIQAIANVLNGDHIPTPRDYAEGVLGHIWRRETVRAILNNEAYIGNLVQLKQGSLSYKDRRQKQKPPEEWVRVLGTHEPIVDEDTWNAIRKMDGIRPRRPKKEDLFAGLLYCGICGRAMKRVINHKDRGGKEKIYTYYICTGHVCVNGEVLKELLIREVRMHMKPLEPQGEKFERELQRGLFKQRESVIRQQVHQREKAEKRVGELRGLICKLYEDRANRVVSADIYKTLMARYEEEMKEKEREIEEAGKLGISESAGSIKNIEVSRNLLQILLKGIWIDPKEGKVQSVRISYRFEENVLL